MKPIQMVDLVGQYEKIKPEVDAALAEVIGSAAFINGPQVKAFEQELAAYLNVKHVIGCGNGTDALQVAMMALGLKPGDEVITASFTFVATVEVLALLGLVPVFADVLPDTFNLDPADVARKVTPKTKAIVPVHLFGQNADMDAILAIAREYNLFVVEDACQSIGSEHSGPNGKRKSGTMGDIGVTSFFPSKNLGCYGDGGALFTNDDELAHKIRRVCNHGSDKRYYHEVVGVNSRLDSLQAAVLRIKLKHLDAYARARNAAAAVYDEAFKDIEGLTIPGRWQQSNHVFHQYTLRVAGGRRDALKKHLEDRGVPAMVYYPVPCHLQVAYKGARCPEGSLPVTEELTREVLSLPMSTELDNEQLKHITSTVKGFFHH
ncbi:MAG TPA: DegT/DnrJ/EryC1/StrS family aminotransferase [Flavobacteriales bacterium]|nr:DegT/DnrJ/EryC1/StrS family aminotransferase [Flavobacteriales bacterium]MCL4280691.1 DegT/DnrJ/EryC1/StrS family aminotransferase [Flavobacteriales bacterium]HRO39837.1 DegT/DnrJ/EryC1/StrS family aminotransferase [Flavobacteriales bacterium]HRP81878.1 DegT/DnrJ/EryC1/StrS family aminotransferase [Flavobacteriales bacterium]